jgi:hypothetical protein
MKNLYIILLFTFGQIVLAQQQNALHFNGLGNHVSVANAGAIIANQIGFSVSGWVEPANTNPGYPNFDGIFGFRNEMNCDFYILQLSATDFECRFRNSANQVYTLTSSTVLLNVWQHVALVYDGANLTFYHNGVAAATMPASGSITNNNETFYLGRLDYQSTQFLFGGKLDEVAIWNKALTLQEAGCLYEYGVNPSDPDLEVYYSMNQGVANGNNTQITHLTDNAGTHNGLLTGFQLTGTTSNFVDGVNQMTQVSDTICKGDTLFFGGQQFVAPGIYTIFTSLPAGCDSAVQLYLYTDSADARVSQNGPVLTALKSNAGYQWVDCNNNYQPLIGDTLQVFTATANGNYAVIVTDGNCTDTSNCIVVNTIGNTIFDQEFDVKFYPNPSEDIITVETAMPGSGIRIFNTSGQLLVLEKFENRVQINVSQFAPGIYFADIEGSFGKRFVKFYVK